MYNHKLTRTQNAKALVGKTIRLTKRGEYYTVPTVIVGKVVKVVGKNASLAEIYFENGIKEYYTWNTHVQEVNLV